MHKKSQQHKRFQPAFFYCNVGDQVICLYCNLICQQWTSNINDLEEVHFTSVPQCPYIRSMLKLHQTNTISIGKENYANTSNGQLQTSNNLRYNGTVHTSAYHRNYIEISKRQESVPSVDDFTRAGFFYTDNPTVEHSRWFPKCAYVKQLYGNELYEEIQESKRRFQKCNERNQPKRKYNDGSIKYSQVLVSDNNTLSRLVAARLDLLISQRLLSQNYDFTSDSDLLIACIILQQQIIHINGNKETIITPNILLIKIYLFLF
ncbi:unnamed protein product [Adineta steineri]|uniref:Uncharacterized protein n=1 Tax=Adineta steineri TaxID=433720 RepID=A0A815HUN9_9BILA|nr:unnamed protein product [Adineta steineri]CAF1299829.1 unnamed protein product [Adineta steineri]CAF1357353.1 unnamed protein product [Adineta steineri]